MIGVSLLDRFHEISFVELVLIGGKNPLRHIALAVLPRCDCHAVQPVIAGDDYSSTLFPQKPFRGVADIHEQLRVVQLFRAPVGEVEKHRDVGFGVQIDSRHVECVTSEVTADELGQLEQLPLVCQRH